MYGYGGHGCFWMGIVGVYECGWVQWEPIEAWGPERRQGETRMVIVGTDRTRQEKENQ